MLRRLWGVEGGRGEKAGGRGPIRQGTAQHGQDPSPQGAALVDRKRATHPGCLNFPLLCAPSCYRGAPGTPKVKVQDKQVDAPCPRPLRIFCPFYTVRFQI